MNRNPKNLPEKKPDKKCNARTPTGYCKHPAGHGTEHLGEGRCRLHGGVAGRPPIHGLYSRRMGLNLREQLEEITTDPQFATMYEEYAQLKMVLMNILGGLPDNFGDELFEHAEVTCRTCGGLVLTDSEAKRRVELILKTIEQLSKTHERIVKTDTALKKVLTPHQVEYLYKRIAAIILDTCGVEMARDILQQLHEINLFYDGVRKDPTNRRKKTKPFKVEIIMEEEEIEDGEIDEAEFMEIDSDEDEDE